MSFQFEDDSALEELLNQQLDRRKQSTSRERTQVLVSQRAIQAPSDSRPSTGSNLVSGNIDERTTETTGNPGSRPLANWLRNRPDPIPNNLEEDGSSKHTSLPVDTNGAQNGAIEDLQVSDLSEAKLQSMSKQGLIQLIRSRIVPKILKEPGKDKLTNLETELRRYKSELEVEKSKCSSLLANQSEQVQLIESKWILLNKQLEDRCTQAEQKLLQVNEHNKCLIENLRIEHKQDLDKMLEVHRLQLDELTQQYEHKLKRMDELHRMEMRSRLKVDGDLIKLETIFNDWQQMIQSTIRELDIQYKSVENLLNKQTIEINSTNENLVQKTQNVINYQAKFAVQNEQLDSLVNLMSKQILPQLEKSSSDNHDLMKEAQIRLSELNKRELEVKKRELEYNEINNELRSSLKETESEKFRLGLEANRLSYERDRLDERSKSLDLAERDLDDRRKVLVQEEQALASNRASLEARFNELKDQNYEVHLGRRKVLEKQDELEQFSARVKRKQRVLTEQVAALKADSKRLNELRDRIRRELDQLRRIQKSLVCSICNERLFAAKSINECKIDSILANRYEFEREANIDSRRLEEEDKYAELLRQDV